MSQSGRLNAPSSVQARRMATISACAVGSLLDVTSFQPSAMIVSLRTMTAPNGPPLFARIFSSASATARCINACSLISQSPRHSQAVHGELAEPLVRCPSRLPEGPPHHQVIAVSFEPKIVMRFLPVVAGPRFLADRGSGDGVSRRNAGFPPALVASTQEYL